MNKKPSSVPVFLIYAGIIHAIGLALLLPMLITLPGPGGEGAPEAAAIDVEIVPASPLAATIEPNGDQTAALPSAPSSEEEIKTETAAEPLGEVEDAAPAEVDKPKGTVAPTEEKAEPATAAPAKSSAAKPDKKAAAVRRSARPAAHAAKKDTKIAPFNGALTGLFSPGAPVRRR